MHKLLVANWKENPRTEAEALKLFRGVAKVKSAPSAGGTADVVICPPFIYFEAIADVARAEHSALALGAQDIFWEERGAFTGQVGPKMLRSLGARYVIIGHSERRIYAKETDAMINKKLKLALADGLHAILCVGEPLAIRQKGIAAAKRYIKNQLKKDLAGVSGKMIIAYEPIWAIGSGKNDKPEDAAAMARFIKKELKTLGVDGGGGGSAARGASPRFLYGGSVNSKNIRDYVQYKEIDGALVGGASLKVDEFAKMIARVAQ